MRFPRRKFLHLAAGAVAVPAISPFAWAQTYPTRPVRVIVGLAAGGATDVVARLAGQWLSERLGQQFIIENRLGAGGRVATEAVVHSSTDGYTLLQLNTSSAINASLYDNLSFDLIRDIAPVASIGRSPLVMVVNPSFPAKTVPEFIAYAKANRGKISMASAGIGTPLHVSGELFNMMTGIDMVHVPYKGNAPALVDLLGGQVQVMFSDLTAIPFIRDGKLRALAVTTATRAEALPNVPAIGDFVAGYEVSTWQGMGAPKRTSAEIVDKLNTEINAGLADPSIKARLADIGFTVFASSPANFGKFIAEETEKFGKVIRAANIKPE